MTKKIITAVSPLKTLRRSFATLSGPPGMGSSGGARTRPTADVSNARTRVAKNHDGLAALRAAHRIRTDALPPAPALPQISRQRA
jgi:hypothetical protein